MQIENAIALLRTHEDELRAAGVERLSVFGSVARGEATDASDIDIAMRLSSEARAGGFAYIGRLDTLHRRLEQILGCAVDVVTEPVRRDALRQSIEREATLAF